MIEFLSGAAVGGVLVLAGVVASMRKWPARFDDLLEFIRKQ